jgi:hypothetical protein
VQPTTPYPTPVTDGVGDFFSLREAGLKVEGGLIGRDAAKIARFRLVKRA